MSTYCVVESCDSYIVCHASGLSWAEAHLLVLSRMIDDDNGEFRNVKMYELEANEPGLGVDLELKNGRKITYYVLDDPGRNVFEDVYAEKGD